MKADEPEEGVVTTSEEDGLVFPVKKSLRADFFAAAAVLMQEIQLEGLRSRRLNLKERHCHCSRSWDGRRRRMAIAMV
jgi:hypothetical protein